MANNKAQLMGETKADAVYDRIMTWANNAIRNAKDAASKGEWEKADRYTSMVSAYTDAAQLIREEMC